MWTGTWKLSTSDLVATIESVHKDLDHYGKRTTLDVVRQRYDVTSDLWEEGGKVLDSCIPYQLYKDVPDLTTIVTIHPSQRQESI